jgi:hypothetical protein
VTPELIGSFPKAAPIKTLEKKACEQQIITDSSEKRKIVNQRATKHKMKHSRTKLGESEEVTCVELSDGYADLTEKLITRVEENCCTVGSHAIP